MSVPLPVTVCINVKIPQEDIIANVMKILRWILLIQRNAYVSILIQGQLSPVCATHVKNYFFKKSTFTLIVPNVIFVIIIFRQLKMYVQVNMAANKFVIKQMDKTSVRATRDMN